MKKYCVCKEENAWYYDFGEYKCQYCMGTLTDKKRVEKIIKYNTPIKDTPKGKGEYDQG